MNWIVLFRMGISVWLCWTLLLYNHWVTKILSLRFTVELYRQIDFLSASNILWTVMREIFFLYICFCVSKTNTISAVDKWNLAYVFAIFLFHHIKRIGFFVPCLWPVWEYEWRRCSWYQLEFRLRRFLPWRIKPKISRFLSFILTRVLYLQLVIFRELRFALPLWTIIFMKYRAFVHICVQYFCCEFINS